jgi:hypothetical protein
MNTIGSRWECGAAFVGRQTRAVACVASAFDAGEELLWVATDDGRMTSLFIDGGGALLSKFSSFAAHDRAQPVLHMQSIGDGVLSGARGAVMEGAAQLDSAAAWLLKPVSDIFAAGPGGALKKKKAAAAGVGNVARAIRR